MINTNKKAAGSYPTAFEKRTLNNREYSNKGLSTNPLPPYGRKLLAREKAGKPICNDIRLFAGHDCWRYAAGFEETQAVLALPLDEDPTDYHWPVQGNSVLISDCTYMSKSYSHALETNYMRKLAHTLLQAGASIVRVIYSDGSLRRYGGHGI
jgi:hypothetical protein